MLENYGTPDTPLCFNCKSRDLNCTECKKEIDIGNELKYKSKIVCRKCFYLLQENEKAELNKEFEEEEPFIEGSIQQPKIKVDEDVSEELKKLKSENFQNLAENLFKMLVFWGVLIIILALSVQHLGEKAWFLLPSSFLLYGLKFIVLWWFKITSRGWRSTQGKLLSTPLVQSIFGNKGTSGFYDGIIGFTVRFSYEYIVGNKIYIGHRYCFSPFVFKKKEFAEKAVVSFGPGDEVTVYFHPTWHRISVLKPGV